MWLCEERCMIIREVSSGEEWEDDEVETTETEEEPLPLSLY